MERRPNSPREESSRYIKDIPAFQDKFRTAFNEIIDNPEHEDLLKRFRYTYEYKRSFPWRPENPTYLGEKGDEAGLKRAFEGALSTYLLDSQYKGENANHRQKYPAVDIDEGFRQKMKTALSSVSQDTRALDHFAASLLPPGLVFVPIGLSEEESQTYVEKEAARHYRSIETVTPEQVSKELKAALEQYWERIDSGNSPDPW